MATAGGNDRERHLHLLDVPADLLQEVLREAEVSSRLACTVLRDRGDAVRTQLTLCWPDRSGPDGKHATEEDDDVTTHQAVRRMLEKFQRLSTLRAGRCTMRFVDLLGTAATTLTQLDVSRSPHLTDISAIGLCVALERLDLSYCRRVCSIAPLASCTSLAWLRIGRDLPERHGPFKGPSSPLVDIGALASTPSLTYLDLTDCTLLHDLRPLAVATQLQWLTVGLDDGEDDGDGVSCVATLDITPLEGCTALTSLNVGSRITVPSGLAALAWCRSLSSVTLTCCKTVVHLDPLLPCAASLLELNLSLSENLVAIGALRECSALKTLDLMYCHSLVDIAPLSSCVSLETLDLSECIMSDVSALSACTNLVTLRLDSSRELTSLAGLSTLCALTLLSLSVSHVTDLQPLAYMVSLSTIDLSDGTGITDASPLTSCGRLTRLDLSSCSALVRLPAPPALVYIDLEECRRLVDIGPLAACAALTHVNMPGCKGVVDVGPLAACTALVHINMSGCTGVSAVDALASCTALSSLDVGQCTGMISSDIERLARLVETRDGSVTVRRPGYSHTRAPNMASGVLVICVGSIL